MRAMILAAGRGERMGALTTHTPKPLLHVANHYLIEYSIRQLVSANIREIVINVSYHGDQIKTTLGDGEKYGAHIVYSEEVERLETGGGIVKALPLLGDEPFIVLSSDIITDYPLANLPTSPKYLAHLVLVSNPSFHPRGDFGLIDGFVDKQAEPTLTFSNVGIYRPELFSACELSHFRLGHLLFPAIDRKQITGEHYQGIWYNIGSPDDLHEANERAREDSNLRPLVSETNTLSN